MAEADNKSYDNKNTTTGLAVETKLIKETLERRGESLGFTNILALSYASEIHKASGNFEPITEWFLNPNSEEQIEILSTQIDLAAVQSKAIEVAYENNIIPLELTSELTIPINNLSVPRLTNDIDAEIIIATESQSFDKRIPISRYCDSFGWNEERNSMSSDQVISLMKDDSVKVINHARGMRSPLTDIKDAYGISGYSLFSLKQMTDYPQIILRRTEELVSRHDIIESKYTDLIKENLILSERESLARSIQRADRTVGYLSASIGSNNLNNWGFFKVQLNVPENLLLNVRDLCLQEAEVLGEIEPLDEETKRRLAISLHDGPPYPDEVYISQNKQDLDEFAILGGIRKEWVVSITDTRDESIIWPIN